MALGKITLVQGLALVVVTLLWAGTMAQSDCTSVLITMAPCVDYVTGTSSTPSVPCCSQLANVVQLQPHCLCMAFSGSSSLGVEVNQTLALALPQLCHVKTPPESSCKVHLKVYHPIQMIPQAATHQHQVNGDAPKTLRRREICLAIEFGDVSGDASTCIITGYVFLGSAMQKLTRLHSSVSGDASIVSLSLVSGDAYARRYSLVYGDARHAS